MTPKVGIGSSVQTSTPVATKEAASQALTTGGLQKVDFALVFATARHDMQEIRTTLTELLGPQAQILGGNSVGIITPDRLSYGGYEIGVALIEASDLKFTLLQEQGLGSGEESKVGANLARKISAVDNASAVLSFYDSVRGQPQAPLNMATPLLEGMQSVFQSKWPDFAGAGMFGDMMLSPTTQICGSSVVSQSATAVVISGNCQLDTVILHGCRPASDYHTITKTEGPVVLEIDNKPAMQVISELLGHDDWIEHPQFVTLGVNLAGKYDAFKEENYANRLCMALDLERQGLIMFEPDLKPGHEVQLMRRSIDFKYISTQVDAFLSKLEGRTPFLALYIDCAGRAAAYCGAEKEEAEEIQKTLAGRIPLLGFYSGVEMAKTGHSVRALDWTGVLCLLSR